MSVTDSDDYALDTKYTIPGDVISSTIRNVHEREENQVNEFLESRLWNRSKEISYTVNKHGVRFFCMKTARYSKKLDKLLSERNKVHENQVYHTFLSEHGSLRPAKRKSSMIK